MGKALCKERRSRAGDRHCGRFSGITDQRPAFTIRRTIGSSTPAAALEWAMQLGTQNAAEKAPYERLLQAKAVWLLRELKSSCATSCGTARSLPRSFTLSIEQPFATDCKVQPWMALLLPRCDGKTTVADLFEMAKQNGWIVPETPAEEFCRLLATLISGGFLQTEELRLPAAAG